MSKKPYPVRITFDRDPRTDVRPVIAGLEEIRYWHEVHEAHRRVTALEEDLPLFSEYTDLLGPVDSALQGLLLMITTISERPALQLQTEEGRDFPLGFTISTARGFGVNAHEVARGSSMRLQAVMFDASAAAMNFWAEVKIPYKETHLPTKFVVETTIAFDEGWQSSSHMGELEVDELDSDEWLAVPHDETDHVLDSFFS